MDATLHALGGLLLNAVPTFLIVFLLYFYLKFVFFRPLARVLQARYEATEGARKKAQEIQERAAARTSEYEEAMRAARAGVYQTQEQLHRKLEAQRAADLEAAHKRAENLVQDAKEQLQMELAQSKNALQKESEILSDQIADTLLGRSAA